MHRKATKDLITYAEGLGYELRPGQRNHPQLVLPGTNVLVTIAGSPSCPRARRNAEADLRRGAREAAAVSS